VVSLPGLGPSAFVVATTSKQEQKTGELSIGVRQKTKALGGRREEEERITQGPWPDSAGGQRLPPEAERGGL